MEKLNFNQENSRSTSSLETRRDGADDIVIFLERTNGFEIFNSEEKKREFINSLTSESTLTLLDRAYGILTQTEIKDRDNFDHPAHVRDASNRMVYKPPMQQLQPQLLDKIILPAIKQMSTEDAALYASLCVNLLHRYPDGNGRLGRLVYALLTAHSDYCMTPGGREDLKLDIISRYNTMNCDPDFISEEVNHFISQELRPKTLKPTDKLTLINVPEHRTMTDRNEDSLKSTTDAELDDEEILLNSNARLRAMSEEDTEDFKFGVMFYVNNHNMSLLEKSKDKGNIQDGSEEYQIDIHKVFESLVTLKDFDTLYLSIQAAKFIRLRIVRDIIMKPQQYQMDDSSGRSIKSLLRYRMTIAYLESLKGDSDDTNFTM